MVLLEQLFCDIILSKSLWESKSFNNSYQRMQMIEILLKYILWYEFLNDLDAQSDFDKKIITKKPVKSNHSYLKYALTSLQKNRGLYHFYLLASQKMAPLACYFITNLKMILTYYYIKRSQRHPLTAICALLKTTEWKLLFIQYPKSGKFLRISRTFFFPISWNS